jgi:phage recombination protein Bet
MAVGNSLIKAQEEKATVKYDVNGQEIKLSPAIIKKYLVSGGGNVSDEEVMMFLSLCKFQKLNPFLREAYLIKYGNEAATIVTGKEVFTKRANRNDGYDGHEAGIIVLSKDGQAIERGGTFKLPDEKIVGGWATVHIKNHKVPIKISVSFDEYVGLKKDGSVNSQWTKKPATMIRKVALVQALREAFPEDFQGLYAAEEREIDESILSAEPIANGEPIDIKPAFTDIEEVEPEKEDPLA